MQHIDTFFDDPYVRAGHLAGEVLPVTIKVVKAEAVGKDKAGRPVVYFEEFEKGMVLNKTNTKRIVALYGSDVDKWPGKRIMLYPTETEFSGDMVECIRIKKEAPPEKA